MILKTGRRKRDFIAVVIAVALTAWAQKPGYLDSHLEVTPS